MHFISIEPKQKVTKKQEDPEEDFIPLTPKKLSLSSKSKIKQPGHEATHTVTLGMLGAEGQQTTKSSEPVPKQHQPMHTVTLGMLGAEGTEGASLSLTKGASLTSTEWSTEKKTSTNLVHTSVSEGERG